MFALVDCNNFYASCERVFRPDLNGKPVVILSNNDGCVIARSNEAKALGIPMGAPAYQFEKVFAENKINVFSSNYALYGDLSARVMNILSSFSKEIEVYSIDESFLKFDDSQSCLYDSLGQEMKKKVVKSTGIPISIGFAATKALSKVANRIAKKFPQTTDGVYIINTEEKRVKALKWLAIGDVWGIGSRHAKRMKEAGINNAFQFTQQSDEWVKKQMSVVGLRLKKDLEGTLTLDLEEPKAKKNIATTRTFDRNYSSYEDVKERIVTFSVSCAEKLRRQNSCCNAMMVFLHTNGHRLDLPQYSKNIVVKFPFPTSSSIELAKFAISGLRKIFVEGFYYKKAGVVIMDITPENQKQVALFENSNPKHQALMNTIDKINQSIGQQKVKLGSQDLKKTWKMKQEKLSPRYTTQLNEIINVFS